jgi:hypothetical protein
MMNRMATRQQNFSIAHHAENIWWPHGSPMHSSAHRHTVIGPNKGINKAEAKGPIVLITIAATGMQKPIEMQNKNLTPFLPGFLPRDFFDS